MMRSRTRALNAGPLLSLSLSSVACPPWGLAPRLDAAHVRALSVHPPPGGISPGGRTHAHPPTACALSPPLPPAVASPSPFLTDKHAGSDLGQRRILGDPGPGGRQAVQGGGLRLGEGAGLDHLLCAGGKRGWWW